MPVAVNRHLGEHNRAAPFPAQADAMGDSSYQKVNELERELRQAQQKVEYFATGQNLLVSFTWLVIRAAR